MLHLSLREPGLVGVLAFTLSLCFAKVFEIRITCYWISLLRLGSAVNYSHVQINRINFPKRFALAQQFLTISGSNLIAAVCDSFSSTFFFHCWSPAPPHPWAARPAGFGRCEQERRGTGQAEVANNSLIQIPTWQALVYSSPFFVSSILQLVHKGKRPNNFIDPKSHGCEQSSCPAPALVDAS